MSMTPPVADIRAASRIHDADQSANSKRWNGAFNQNLTGRKMDGSGADELRRQMKCLKRWFENHRYAFAC
jgi:hypothetical protein